MESLVELIKFHLQIIPVMSKNRISRQSSDFERFLVELDGEFVLPQATLPTRKETLQQLMGLIRNGTTLAESARESAHGVIKLWEKAHLPTREHKHITTLVAKLYERLREVKKNCSRRTDTQLKREEEFRRGLDQLFDISHHRLQEMVTIEEDREFLEDQRSARCMKMVEVDKVFVSKRKRKAEREETEQERRKKEILRRESQNALVELVNDAEENSDTNEDFITEEEAEENEMSKSGTERAEDWVTVKLPKRILTAEEVCMSADRHGLSKRQLFATVASVIKASTATVDDFVLSPSSATRSRMEVREKVAKRLKETYIGDKKENLVVHWDGKIVEDFKRLQDRIGVVVSGEGGAKLLAIPAVVSSSGENQAAVVHQAVLDWHLEDGIVALSFDTTASNTGKHVGTCVILERMLNKKLMWLACRHHVLELLLRRVGATVFGKTTGPSNKDFKDFKDTWPTLNNTIWTTLEIRDGWMAIRRTSVLEQLRQLLHNTNRWLREDYKEAVEITYLLLGGNDIDMQFKKPGAFHHARWMANILYYGKMLLFSSQVAYSTNS